MEKVSPDQFEQGDDQVNSVHSQFLRPLRVLRALRILRAYRMLNLAGSQLQRQGFVLFLTVVSLIICTTGILQAMEYCDPKYHDPLECDPSQNLTYFEAMVRNITHNTIKDI